MANHVTALKRVRQTERRTQFNRMAATRLRNQIRSLRKALAAKNPGDLKTALSATFSLLDKAARKGYVKANNAARYKSRIAHHLKKLAA